MRIANKSNCLAVPQIWSIHFIVLKLCDGKNNPCLLTRKSCCLQMLCSRITLTSELVKHLLSDHRVGNTHNLVIVCIIICIGQRELLSNQLNRLFRQELRRQVLTRSIPVSLFLQLVDGRQLSLITCNGIDVSSVRIIVVTLTIRLNVCTKGIVGIITAFLENLHLRRTRLLVGVKDDVYSIWNIV